MKEALYRERQKSWRKSLLSSSTNGDEGATRSFAGNVSMSVSRAAGLLSSATAAVYPNRRKGGHPPNEWWIYDDWHTPAECNAAAAGQQYRKSHVWLLVRWNPHGRRGDFVCPLFYCGAGGVTLPKPYGRETFLKRARTGWDNNACPSGRWGSQPYLYFTSKGGRRPWMKKLKKLTRRLKMEKRNCAGWSMRENLAEPGEAINPEWADAPALYQRGGTGKLPAPPGACDGWTGQLDFEVAVPLERKPKHHRTGTCKKTEKWVKAERRKRRKLLPERQAGVFHSERGRSYTPL